MWCRSIAARGRVRVHRRRRFGWFQLRMDTRSGSGSGRTSDTLTCIARQSQRGRASRGACASPSATSRCPQSSAPPICARVAPFLLCQLSAFPRAERCPKSIRARQVGSNGKMLHKLLFGLLAAFLAGALGAGLLSITPTPWRLLTASKSSSVFCSSASSAGIKSALPPTLPTRALPACPSAATRS